MEITRPKFVPEVLGPSIIAPLAASDNSEWVQVLSAKCHFGLNVFLSTLRELSMHPERNSSLVLRAETAPSSGDAPSKYCATPDIFHLESELHLRLIPKAAKRDSKITQHCLFYRTLETTSSDHDSEPSEQGLVLLIPDVKTQEEIPFYHPDVRKLAFHYEALSPAVEAAEDDEQAPVGIISISVLPWPAVSAPGPFEGLKAPTKPPRKRSPLAGPSVTSTGSTTSPPIDPAPAAVVLDQADDVADSLNRLSHTSKESRTGLQPNESALPDRLYRTCLALLDRLHKHGYGNAVGYQKRRQHDVLVDKASFQDLYLTLKERHRHLDSRPSSSQSCNKFFDTKRHVFKGAGDSETPIDDWSHWGRQDVALAAFLMLLWRDEYPSRESNEDLGRPWDSWGRPSGGFLDLGCGNALLVHILLSEGYNGKGIELRSRKTWPLYPESTQDNLIELGINPPEWFPETMNQWQAGDWPGRNKGVVQEGMFLIGNHADEMTPWLPLLSLIPKTPVPFISLPCCLHTLSDTFTSSVWTPPQGAPDVSGGLDEGESRYKAYIMWLSYCNWKAGWKIEREPLRVPSTRAWALIARSRCSSEAGDEDEDLKQSRLWALDQIQEVRSSGSFIVRKKEGNQH